MRRIGNDMKRKQKKERNEKGLERAEKRPKETGDGWRKERNSVQFNLL